MDTAIIPNIYSLMGSFLVVILLLLGALFFLKKVIAKQKPWEPIIISDNITWSEFSRLNLFNWNCKVW